MGPGCVVTHMRHILERTLNPFINLFGSNFSQVTVGDSFSLRTVQAGVPVANFAGSWLLNYLKSGKISDLVMIYVPLDISSGNLKFIITIFVWKFIWPIMIVTAWSIDIWQQIGQHYIYACQDFFSVFDTPHWNRIWKLRMAFGSTTTSLLVVFFTM